MQATSSGRLSFPGFLSGQIRQSPCQYVVTGGSGWIGQAALEMLEAALGDAITERVFVFGSKDGRLQLRSGRELPYRALDRLGVFGLGPAIFFHCAFLTKDRLADQTVEHFVGANRKISDCVADAIGRCDARGFFMPSSGAVYKKATSILDDDLIANTYGAMKIADEKRFGDLAARKNIPLCMPRLFNLSGPFINKHELYALASIIAAVLDNRPIVIRAAHRVIRSYIHVADLVSLGLAMLFAPQAGDQPVFDTVGEDVLEIGDLADRVRNLLGNPELDILRPATIEGGDDVYVGDGRSMKSMLQSRSLALRDLDEQIHDTANFMRTVEFVYGRTHMST